MSLYSQLSLCVCLYMRACHTRACQLAWLAAIHSVATVNVILYSQFCVCLVGMLHQDLPAHLAGCNTCRHNIKCHCYIHSSLCLYKRACLAGHNTQHYCVPCCCCIHKCVCMCLWACCNRASRLWLAAILSITTMPVIVMFTSECVCMHEGFLCQGLAAWLACCNTQQYSITCCCNQPSVSMCTKEGLLPKSLPVLLAGCYTQR